MKTIGIQVAALIAILGSTLKADVEIWPESIDWKKAHWRAIHEWYELDVDEGSEEWDYEELIKCEDMPIQLYDTWWYQTGPFDGNDGGLS